MILIFKPKKEITRKENYRPVSLMNLDARVFPKTLANQIQTCIKVCVCMHPNPVGVIPDIQVLFTI